MNIILCNTQLYNFEKIKFYNLNNSQKDASFLISSGNCYINTLRSNEPLSFLSFRQDIDKLALVKVTKNPMFVRFNEPVRGGESMQKFATRIG